MPWKYFLLAFVILYNQGITTSHILTSRDLPLASCMRMMAVAMHDLCGIYGESSSEETGFIMSQLANRGYDIKPYILKHCCSQPCSMPELLLAC